MESKNTHCKWCAAINCNNSKNKRPDLPFFLFPADPERCMQWVINTRRADLDHKTPKQLHSGTSLCSEHFEPSCFSKTATKRLRLLKSAVPTLFNFPDQPAKYTPSCPPRKERAPPTSSAETIEEGGKSLRAILKNYLPHQELESVLTQVHKSNLDKTAHIPSGTQRGKKQCKVNLPTVGEAVMEEDERPVPQMLFINEAFLHSKFPDSSDTNTIVVKQEDNELCSQHSSLEIKTEDHTLDYGFYNDEIKDEAPEIERETESTLICDDSDQMKPAVVTEGLVSSQNENESKVKEKDRNLLKNISIRVKCENELEDTPESLVFNYAENVKRAKISEGEEQISMADVPKIKVENKLKTDTDSLVDSENKMSSEFFPCKQKNLEDCDISSGPKKDELAGIGEQFHSGKEIVSFSKLTLDKRKSSMEKPGLKQLMTIPSNVKTVDKFSGSDKESQSLGQVTNIFQCLVCNKLFTKNSSLKVHMRIHTGERPYKCTVCDKTFIQSCRLKEHMCIHTGEKPYKCNVCGKEFIRSSCLKKHMNRHKDENRYECSVCEKVFMKIAYLSLHMKIHTGEKFYKCTLCDKLLTTSFSLKTHMKTHTGERPYKCGVCDKSFIQSFHLKEHMSTHTGEKPYKCNVCDKTFFQSSYLKKHMSRHADESP